METAPKSTVGPKKVQERLAKARSDPKRRARVSKLREQMDQEERQYRLSLATIRKAAELSQVELAKAMNSTQPRVSEVEKGNDFLLSTLANYLAAAGASEATLRVTLHGQVVDLPLALRDS